MAMTTVAERKAENGALPPAVGDAGQVVELVRRTRLVAAVTEGHAFTTEVMKQSAALQTLGATGNRAQIVHAAGQLGSLAQTYRAEFHRLASEVEWDDPEDDAA